MGMNSAVFVPPAGGSGSGGPGTGTPPSLLIGKTLVVSAVGNDGTGARQDWRFHYATFDAAFADAQAGDHIIVMPGSYTAAILLKNSINVFMFAGSTIQVDAIGTGLSSANLLGYGDITAAEDIAISLAASQSMRMDFNSFTGPSLRFSGASTDAQYLINCSQDIICTGFEGLYIDVPAIASFTMNIRDFIMESGSTSSGMRIWGNHSSGNEIIIKGRNCISNDQGFVCLRYGDPESDNLTNCQVLFDRFASNRGWETLTNVIVGAVDVCQESLGNNYVSKYMTVFGHSSTIYECIGVSTALIIAACQWVFVNGHVSSYGNSQCLLHTNQSATRTVPASVKQYCYYNLTYNQNEASSEPAFNIQGANEMYLDVSGFYQRRMVDLSGGNIKPVITGNNNRHQSAVSTSNPIEISGDNEVLYLQDFNLHSGGASSNINAAGDDVSIQVKDVKLTGSTTNCISTGGTVNLVLLSLYADKALGANVTNVVSATTIIVDSDII